jgi:hypothetical protein
MKVQVQVTAKLEWKFGLTKDRTYVAICAPIAQTVQADSFTDLMASMNEALDSTLRELLSTGDLENFLREHGWVAQSALPKRNANVRFDVPFNLKQVRERDLEEAFC